MLLGRPPRLVAAPAQVPVIDLHVDLSYRSLYKHGPFSEGSGEFRARDLLPAGLRGVVLPLFVPRDAPPVGRSENELERSYAWVFGQILATPPYSLPGCSIHRAGREAGRAVETWLAFEGSEPLPPDPNVLRRWVIRGVRVFGIVHSQHTKLASSSGEPGGRGGLTARGRAFVRAVYAAGGIVDVSHASDETTSQAIAIAEELGRPIVATHSNARALSPHPRNLKDEHIRGIARTGGVVGVNFHQPFLARTGADLGWVVRNIEYLVELGGHGVVAIGSDFEGGIRPVAELRSARDYPRLAEALAAAGVAPAHVRAYLAGNARRVLCGAPKASPP